MLFENADTKTSNEENDPRYVVTFSILQIDDSGEQNKNHAQSSKFF